MNYEVEVLLLDDEEESLVFSKHVLMCFIPERMIHTAKNVEEALNQIHTFKIQLAFLDVELTHSDGFTFTDYIHKNHPEITVVILTGHVDLGAKSYDYEPFDFLVKPVDVLRLERTLQRFQKIQTEKKTSDIVIETGDGIIKLNVKEIIYISKNGNNCMIHCAFGQVHKINSTLEKIEAILGSQNYVRTHQSFLAPLDRIRQMKLSKFGSTYEAVLDSGDVIPVSRNKYGQLKEAIIRRSVHL